MVRKCQLVLKTTRSIKGNWDVFVVLDFISFLFFVCFFENAQQQQQQQQQENGIICFQVENEPIQSF